MIYPLHTPSALHHHRYTLYIPSDDLLFAPSVCVCVCVALQGMTPRSAKVATPNVVLATPVLGGTGGMGSTPMILGHSDNSSSSSHGGQGVLMASSSSGAGMGGFNGVGRTPLRDQFGLNQTPQHEGMHGGNSDTFSVSDAASVSGQSMMSSRYAWMSYI